jgi:hypothetical protein
MVVPGWVVPVVTLCGSLIVSVGNYAVQRWRFRLDRLMVATDQLCIEITSASRHAAEYWFLDASSEEASAKCRRAEPELIGAQSRLQQLIAAIQEQDPNLQLGEASEAVMNLFDGMTGGEFAVGQRAADIGRAHRVYATSAELIGHLRIAVARRSRTLW